MNALYQNEVAPTRMDTFNESLRRDRVCDYKMLFTKIIATAYMKYIRGEERGFEMIPNLIP